MELYKVILIILPLCCISYVIYDIVKKNKKNW